VGIFSSAPPPPLNDVVEDALSAAFRVNVVGKKAYEIGVRKLADAQAALLASLEPGERLQVIVPCLKDHTYYQDLAVLTQKRVLRFKKQIDQQMALGYVAGHHAGVHPNGYVLLEIKGRNYVPYSTGLGKKAFDEYLRNSLSFYIPAVETAQHFVALLDGIRTNPNAAI
jgi:hypothetical protein